MKIACITAGAGKMYCGSCLRDNALARALLDAGHDVLLIPTYTPTRTDEPNVSLNRVFLGGINIYLQHHFQMFRKAPRIVDRLCNFRPFLQFVSRLGMSVNPADLGGLTVSMLRGMNGPLRKEIIKLVRFLADEISPQIVNIPNSLLISLASAIKAELNVPVCCTFQGEDLFLSSLNEPYHMESIQLIRKHADHVDTFIAVSYFAARRMSDYLGINGDRIQVVPLGIHFDDFDFTNGSHRDIDPFTIGYLARIAPEKGLHILCEAYHILKTRDGQADSRLWAAGYLPPEQKPYLADIQKRLASWRLSSQFRYHGELDRQGKLNFLKSINVFSVPGPYDDPKGLFLLEAMACGIPVVQPRRGAFTEMVETTGGGILVDPESPDALAQALLELWRDSAKRADLGTRAYKGVRAHYSVTHMAEATLAIYESLIKPE